MRWGFIRLFRPFGACLLALSLLVACSSKEDGSDKADSLGDADVSQPDGAVATDTPAPQDVPQVALCTSDDGCAEPGAACTCEGLCEVFETNPCLIDKNCPTEQYCDVCAGFCALEVGLCDPCKDHGACGQGGACLPFAVGGSFCATDCLTKDGCPVGFDCVEVHGFEPWLCLPDTGDCQNLGLCTSDGECPDGEICSDHLKICVQGCADDDECAGDLICEAARCQEPCVTTADCAPGAECVDGHCKIPGACETAADCFQPETYCDKTTGQCAPGCLVDADCQDASKQCDQKKCVPKGCLHNYQCAFGQICQKETGACVDSPDGHCQECDAGSENQCGGDPNLCLTFTDTDPNTGENVEKGDFCLLPCENDPIDQCPQGYGCNQIQMDGVDGFYCVRSCWVDPVGAP